MISYNITITDTIIARVYMQAGTTLHAGRGKANMQSYKQGMMSMIRVCMHASSASTLLVEL